MASLYQEKDQIKLTLWSLGSKMRQNVYVLQFSSYLGTENSPYALTFLSIYIIVSLIGILLKFLDKDFVNGTVLVVNCVKFRMPTVRKALESNFSSTARANLNKV